MKSPNTHSQAEQLAALVHHALHTIEYDPDAVIESMCVRSEQLARIVHYGQKDLAGEAYIKHPLRVASKASTALGYCAGILHDIMEDGKHLGITREFLLDKMCFPVILVDIVCALSRRDGESYFDYITRVLQFHTAAKAKLDDSIDNADVTRYQWPNKEDQIRCGRYLDKAHTLKASITFQRRLSLDYIFDLAEMAQIAPMIFACSEELNTDSEIYQRIYFGYQFHHSRRYTFSFNAVMISEGDWRAVVSTYPARERAATKGIYKPRQMSMKFFSKNHALVYLQDVKACIESCEHITPAPLHMVEQSRGIVVAEQAFIKELEQNNI